MRGYTPSWLTAGVAAVLTLCMAAAMGVAPHSAWHDAGAPRRLEVIALPDLRDQLEMLADAGATYVHEERARRGDTIVTLLRRLGVEDPDAQQFISRDPAARTLFNLQPEQVVQAEVDQDNLLVSLRTSVDGTAAVSRELVIRRAGGLQKAVFQANLQAVRNELRYEMRSGAITAGGFFRTMDVANVPDDIVRQLISIFAGVVDFQHDIVQGDRFRMVYEAGFRDGALVRNGRVVAVELVNRGQRYQALWYDGAEGSNSGAYYTLDGRRMARPFLRSPVEFSRLSSGFGWRNHPLHHQWIQHKGVDFAAPTGTRVFATADGTVDFVGQQTGYGNIVILKHPDGYSTYYAHLSGFAGIQPGQRIAQGQVIAYVGQTGWATGPHLHYELRFKDVPQNPLSVMLMEPVTLTGRARQGFLSQASDMLSRIDVLRGIEVASSLG
ncbi:M23 family metallopeptidase [Cupriavidus sp. 8B]